MTFNLRPSVIARLLLLAFLTASLYLTAPAQNPLTGSIEGKVIFGENQQPASGVKVIIRDEYRGVESTVFTDVNGRYYKPFLQPSGYSITCELTGYEPDPKETKVVIYVATEGRITGPPPFVLVKPGPVVQPSGPTLLTQNQPPALGTEPDALSMVSLSDATRGGNFDIRQLQSLPLASIRSFDTLALLLPGVAPSPLAIGRTVGPGIGAGVGTSGQFAVNGLRSRSNNFTVDGSDSNDEDIGVRRQGFTSLVPQSIESIQDFQVSTLLPTPQYGRNMAAQVNAVSRSGERNFHGTVYGFLNDRRLNSHDFFDNASRGASATTPLISGGAPVTLDGQPIVLSNPASKEIPFTRGQYGLVVGGPISAASGTFFFTSLEHQTLNSTQKSHFAVPTVRERGLLQRGDTGLGSVTQPVFPSSDIGEAFFSLFPFANNPLGPYGANTFTQLLPADAKGTIFSFKLDQKLGANQSVAGRYNISDDETVLPVTGEALFSSLRPLVRTQNFSLFHNWTASSNLSNQARFSFGRTRLRFEEVRNPFLVPSKSFPNRPFLLNAPFIVNDTIPGRTPQYRSIRTASGARQDIESAQIISAPGFPGNLIPIGPLGQVILSGYSPLGVDVFNFPQSRANNTFQYADSLIYNRAGHRIATGVDIRRTHLNSSLERNFRPLAVFNGAANLTRIDAIVSPPQQSRINATLGGALFTDASILRGSDFMALGAPNGLFQAQAITPNPTIGLRYWQNDFFVSDQIRLASTFTLTLGLRYELNTVPSEVNQVIEKTFQDPQIQKLPDLAKVIAGRTQIYTKDTNNFAPHIAMAWDPTGEGKTALRAGYGIYYDQILGAVVSQSRNLFPSFLTLNFAGVDAAIIPPGALQLSSGLGFVNPAVLSGLSTGTLNNYFAGSIQPADLVLQLSSAFMGLSAGAAGAAFTLPAAELRTPYAQHWGITAEQELPGTVLASAGYVGTRGTHLLRFSTPNYGPNAIPVVKSVLVSQDPSSLIRSIPFFLGDNVAPGFNPATVTGGRPSPTLGAYTSIESDAVSNYHALQLQLTKRFSRGLQATAAYTWSHAIDEVSDLFALAGARTIAQNSFNRRAERGDANFDVRQRFVYSAIWDLPVLRQNKVLGGWQISSIGTFQTGQPFSKYFCCDGNYDGNFGDRIVQTPTGVIANASRNLYRADGVASVDLAVNKKFHFTDSQWIEFRTEFFNLFNHTHFGIPVNERLFPSYEKPVNTTIPARLIQFALKYNF